MDIIDIINDLEDSTYKIISNLLNIDFNKKRSMADENEGLTFVLHIEIDKYNLFNENNKPVFPNIDIEMEIEEINNELVLKPNIKADFFNKGFGLKSLGWSHFGSCGRDIKKLKITISG